MMKGIFVVALSVVAVGCNKSNDWEQRYADCKFLAGVMASQPDQFIKPPNCEVIPTLCRADPNGSACQAEIRKYYRK